jgi:hypothetical protein
LGEAKWKVVRLIPSWRHAGDETWGNGRDQTIGFAFTKHGRFAGNESFAGTETSHQEAVRQAEQKRTAEGFAPLPFLV